MAYIINTSPVALTTLNLVQGRVQLEPLSYCELQDVDASYAKQVYNSKDLNLYVAETKEELDLILGAYKKPEEPKQEVPSGIAIITEDAVTVVSSEESAQSEETEESEEESLEEDQSSEVVTEEQGSEETSKEDSEESKESQENSSEEDPKQKYIETIKASIDSYREAADIESLKALAKTLGISFMYNISFDKLSEKILTKISA